MACLNKFIVATYKAATSKKAARIERERQKREWEEQGRLDVLNEQARAWQGAQQLHACILAVRNAGFYAQPSIMGGQDVEEWCTWAMEQANRLDPTMTSPPSVLDYKSKFYWYRWIPG